MERTTRRKLLSQSGCWTVPRTGVPSGSMSERLGIRGPNCGSWAKTKSVGVDSRKACMIAARFLKLTDTMVMGVSLIGCQFERWVWGQRGRRQRAMSEMRREETGTETLNTKGMTPKKRGGL